MLDTNVLIAALVARGACHELLEHCAREHEVITSDFILNELRDKLTDKFAIPRRDALQSVALFRSRFQRVNPAALPQRVCRDADDDAILATALAGNCAAIVSGDKDLLILTQWSEIAILSPREFWAFEARYPQP